MVKIQLRYAFICAGGELHTFGWWKRDGQPALFACSIREILVSDFRYCIWEDSND